MDLALLSAVELLALADEEVVPLAAEMAHAFSARGETALREIVTANYAAYQGTDKGGRLELLGLAASALVAMGAARRDVRLCQLPAATRVVRLPRQDFAAFRLGALRHVVFGLGTYDAPRPYAVLRLLEMDGGRSTGREALAEVTFVSEHPGEGHTTTFVVSVKPWRGAGTQSSDEAVMLERRAALDDLEAVLLKLDAACPEGTAKGRLRAAALRLLSRVRDMTLVEEPIAAE